MPAASRPAATADTMQRALDRLARLERLADHRRPEASGDFDEEQVIGEWRRLRADPDARAWAYRALRDTPPSDLEFRRRLERMTPAEMVEEFRRMVRRDHA
jgi:hypothetical protein